jgi:predicted secreted protein
MFTRTYHPSITLSVLAALLVGLLVMAGPVGAAPHFSAADNDQHVIVGVGDQVEVALRSDSNSGFAWMPVRDEGALLRHMTRTFQRTALDGNGMQTLNFVAVRPGSTILQLHYARPQSGDAGARRVFTLNIEVVRSWNDAGTMDRLFRSTTPGYRDAGASAPQSSMSTTPGYRDAGASAPRSSMSSTPGFRDAGASAP